MRPWLDLHSAGVNRQHSVHPAIIRRPRFCDGASNDPGERYLSVSHIDIGHVPVDPDVPLEARLDIRRNLRVGAFRQVVDRNVIADVLRPLDALGNPGDKLLFRVGTDASG